MRPHLVAWMDGWMSHAMASLLAPTWFTCVGLAGVIGACWMIWRARRAGLDAGNVASVVLWSYLAAVIAGIAVPMAIDTVEHAVSHGDLKVRWAGMTSFWGYLAGFGVAVALTRRYAIALPRFADVIAAPLGAALILSRLGCFLAGCDFGKVTSLPWAMRFPMRSPAWHDHVRAGLLPPGRDASLPVHPTQLYEAVVGLMMIGVAIAVGRSAWGRARPGRAFLAAAGTYGVGRIGVEMLRGDAGRGLWLGLSSGQLFSLALIAAVAAALMMQRRAIAVMSKAVVAAAVMVGIVVGSGGGNAAMAWPAPTPAGTGAQPAPAPTPAPVAPTAAPPYDQQQPQQPISPYDAQQPMQPQPVMMPPRAMTPPPQAPALEGRPRYELGAMFGFAGPLNRRENQVGALVGFTISVGAQLPHDLMLWLDFDSLGNRDASHGSLTFSAGTMRKTSSGKLEIGGRIGVGFTLVNFDEPAFRDVTGSNLRFEGLVNYQLNDRWQLWLRPIGFDVLQASQLGGPIVTYQFRAGVAMRFGSRYPSRAAPPPQQPQQQQPYPYGYPPQPQPYPYQPQPYPPQPQPYPPQPQPQGAPQ